MSKVVQVDVPADSLIAGFGAEGDYRDCFVREAPGEVSLAEFIERFYCSTAFRPERLALGLIGRGASNADVITLARGGTESFAAWNVVARRTSGGLVAEHGPEGSASPTGRPQAREGRGNRGADALRKTKTSEEILLRDFSGATASWLSVQSMGTGTRRPSSGEALGQTRLLFGSWLAKPDRPLIKATIPFHVWYSKVLLAGA